MVSVRKRFPDTPQEVWVVNWTQGESRKLKTFKSEKEARQAKSRIERDIAAGRRVFSAANYLTVKQAAAIYMTHVGRRLNDGEIGQQTYKLTWRTLEEDILAFNIGRAKLADVRPLAIQEWVDKMRGGQKASRRTPQRIHAAVSLLSRILDEGCRLEYLDRNVIKTAPPHMPRMVRGTREMPSLEEIRLIVGALDPTTPCGLMIKMAIMTGMRRGEISALQWRDVDLDNGVIAVRASLERVTQKLKSPKTKAGVRDIPVVQSMVEDLRAWKKQTENKGRPAMLKQKWSRSDFVFRSEKTGKPIVAELDATWKEVLKQVGLEDSGYVFHSLRHAAASLFIKQGLPPKQIQNLMGHASIQMTFDRYGKVFSDDRTAAEAIVGLDKFLAEQEARNG